MTSWLGPMIAATQTVETQRQLVLLGGWALWIQILVGVLALGVLGLTVFNYRSLQPRRRRWGMVGLRLAVVAMLIAVFYQPAFLEEQVARGRNLVVVLADGSESMSLPHGDTSRRELVARFLARHGDLWDRLEEEDELVFHRFGDGLDDLPDLASSPELADEVLSTKARSTLVLEALAQVRERYRNHDMGAVVLMTDGIDTTAASRQARLDTATAALVRDLDAPIVSFTLPDDGRLRDISVADVSYNNFAFLMNASSLEATIHVHGYAEGEIVARLLVNGLEVSRQPIVFEPGRTEYGAMFDFVPRELGKQVYAIAVDRLPDEVYADNNVRQVVINVIRDKVRVLQIVGQPSWDERFLRNHLKEDPNVDLISFFILINRTNVRAAGRDETALIPFPARELFEEELGGFDLVVFQNFNYGPFQTRRYLPRVAEFVNQGGAFLMVGGPLSFSSGGYYGTEITDVLPVDIPPSFEEGRLLNREGFSPQLTEAGEHHPITRLALDPALNEAAWKKIEPLEGVNRVTRPKPDSVVLLEHPSLQDDAGGAMPVVAVRDVGLGRSMAVTTDTSWHWSFVAAQHGGNPRHYDTFWSRAIRWLIKDPEMDLVQVRVLREQVPVGEEARATIQVFLPDYQPAADQAVEVLVRVRDEGAGAGEGEVVLKLDDVKTDATGTLDVVIPLERAAIYEVEARAAVVRGRLATGSDLFVGTDLNPEFETVVGDGRLLGLLAEASGGSVQSLTTETPQLDPHPPRVTRVLSRQHDELWNAPWVLGLLVALFGAEWWLRRRYGFL